MAVKISPNVGFTLIELMIVIAIAGILAIIAVPSYTEYLKNARRSDAQTSLMGLANAMERHFTDNSSYTGAADAQGVPSIFASATPVDGSKKYYNLRVTVANSSAYTLQAQPIAGTSQATDGLLELKSNGERGWDKDNSGALSASEKTWEK